MALYSLLFVEMHMKVADCNKLFKEPVKGPKTGKEVSVKTQKRYMRACKVMPISSVRAFFEKPANTYTTQTSASFDVQRRFVDAGGVVAMTRDDATHVVTASPVSSNVVNTEDGKYIMSVERFAKMYYNMLYTECERFKADETHSPKTLRRIAINGPTHRKWVEKCAEVATPVPLADAPNVSDVSNAPNVMNANAVKDTVGINADAQPMPEAKMPRARPPKRARVNKKKSNEATDKQDKPSVSSIDLNTPPQVTDNKKAKPHRRVLTRDDLVKRVRNMCLNDIEPVTLDKLEELDEEQLRKIVTIGEGHNKKKQSKHCLIADSAYKIYEAAAKRGDAPRDPLNPAHKFTEAEIKRILRLTKNKPVQKDPKGSSRDRSGMRLRFLPQTVNGIALYKVVVAAIGASKSEYEVYSLGYIPAEIDIKNSGSTDMTSAVLVAHLNELFDQGKFVTVGARGTLHVNATSSKEFRKPVEYWIDAIDKPTMLQRFKDLVSKASNM